MKIKAVGLKKKRKIPIPHNFYFNTHKGNRDTSYVISNQNMKKNDQICFNFTESQENGLVANTFSKNVKIFEDLSFL